MNEVPRPRRQVFPTLTILIGLVLLLAGVYRELPAWLGMGGVVLLFAGGIWALSRSGLQRREAAETYWNSYGSVPPTLGDAPHGHHHSGFDGGGFFDGGGGHGGH